MWLLGLPLYARQTTTRAPKILWALLICGSVFTSLKAQSPTIQHSALECLPNDQFPLVIATFDSESEIQTGRVYFRSDRFPDFYYVEGQLEEDTFQATLPIPSEETARVVYYIEIVDDEYNSARTEEFGPDVTSGSDCHRRDPDAAWYTGSSPGIVVGATQVGMAAVPPGFQAAGIIGFVTAAGTAAGVGGGLGVGTAAAVGGAVAAGSAVAVAASSGGSPTTTTTVSGAIGGSPPSTPTTTTTVPGSSSTTVLVTVGTNESPLSCFETDPYPPTITEGDSIRLDASCAKADRSGGGTDAIKTYVWDLGDGRTKQGRQIKPIFRVPGVYTVTLTVTDSGGSSQRAAGSWSQEQTELQDTFSMEITVQSKPEPVTACFASAQFGPMGCVELNASCSTGPIVNYDWDIDSAGVLKNQTGSGQVVVYDWQGLGCSPPVNMTELGTSLGAVIPPGPTTTISVRLTVTSAEGSTDVAVNAVDVVTSVGRDSTQIIPISFNSLLDVPASQDGPHGYVQMNGARSDAVSATSVFQHRLDGNTGENRVTATTTPRAGEGLWRFDFQGTRNFAPGSIKVKLGRVISVNAYSVVYRVDRPGERVEFSYELRPGER